MHQEQTSNGLTVRALVVALVAVCYGLLLTSNALPASFATVLNALVLAVLGVAVAWHTLARVGSVEAVRLGGQAQASWQAQRTLALISAGAVYIVLVLGTLAVNSGALRHCTTWPICTIDNPLALLAVLHRGAAAFATLLVVALAIQTFHVRESCVLRVAAGCSLGLVVVQNIIGMIQVLLAASGVSLPEGAARLAHLAVGGLAWAALVVLATLVVRVPPSKRAVEARTNVVDAVKEPSLLKDYVSLTKPGVISLLIFTTLAAMFITPNGLPSFWLVFWTMVGGWLMPAGAHALNCYFDRDIDVLMGRTGRRPIPSGRIPAWHALALGLALGVIAFVVLAMFVNITTALLALAGYFYYVVFYTLMLKRKTYNNIVIGGGAGAFPPLVGWAAVTGNLSLASLLLFAIIFYWTPPHFWALALIRQKDYANAGVPMLPVVAGDAETKKQILLYTVMMVALTVLPTPLQLFGLAYLVMALVLGAWFLRYVFQLFRNDTTATRWGLYRFSLLYLFLLFVAMMLDRLVFA